MGCVFEHSLYRNNLNSEVYFPSLTALAQLHNRLNSKSIRWKNCKYYIKTIIL